MKLSRKPRPTSWSLVILLLVIAGFSSQLLLAQGLPASVRADLLNTRIVGAMRDGRTRDALAAISEYQALEREGVTVPPAIRFSEAVLAQLAGDTVRTHDALVAYLAKADRTDPNYQQAISLFDKVSRDPQVAGRMEHLQAEATRQQEADRAALLRREQQQRYQDLQRRCANLEAETAKAFEEFKRAPSCGLLGCSDEHIAAEEAFKQAGRASNECDQELLRATSP